MYRPGLAFANGVTKDTDENSQDNDTVDGKGNGK